MSTFAEYVYDLIQAPLFEDDDDDGDNIDEDERYDQDDDYDAEEMKPKNSRIPVSNGDQVTPEKSISRALLEMAVTEKYETNTEFLRKLFGVVTVHDPPAESR